MSYNVSVNANLTFDDRESARFAAQAFEVIAGTAKFSGGGARITEHGTGLNVTVREQTYDRSKIVRGFQAAEEQIRKYTTAVDKQAGITGDPEFWAGLFETGRQTGQVDLVTFTALAAERLGIEDAKDVVATVIRETAAAAAEREYRTAVTLPKVRNK